MTIMVISDIHGKADDLNNALKVFEKNEYDKLIILGDIESTPIINSLLSKYITKLILVRGNCDHYCNDIFLPLPMHELYQLEFNNHNLYFSHGHHGMPKVEYKENDFCIMGHTHMGSIKKYHGIYLCNPGSIGKPRGFTKKTYLTIDENEIVLKTLDDKIIKKEIYGDIK